MSKCAEETDKRLKSSLGHCTSSPHNSAGYAQVKVCDS